MERQPPSGAFFDDSLWPLLLVQVVGVLRDAALEEFFTKSTSYLWREERHVCILDMSRSNETGSAAKRRRQAEWLVENEALIRERVLGTALIIHSPFVRLAVRALLHLKSPCSPYIVASGMQEAVLWAAERFEEAGLVGQAQRIRAHYGLQPSGLLEGHGGA